VILVATSTANCGFDDSRICYVVQNGLPFDFLSFLQELGRAGSTRVPRVRITLLSCCFESQNFYTKFAALSFFNIVPFLKPNGKKMDSVAIALFKKTQKFKQQTTKLRGILLKHPP
jgi:hypothetical protein